MHGFINSNSFSLRFFTQGPQNPRPLRISNVTSFPYLWASCFQLGGLLDQQQPGSVVGWEGMPVTRSGGLVEASQEQGRPGGCCPEADRSGQLGAGARRSPTRALARRGLGLGDGKMSCAQEIRGRSGKVETQSPFFLSLATNLSMSTCPHRGP